MNLKKKKKYMCKAHLNNIYYLPNLFWWLNVLEYSHFVFNLIIKLKYFKRTVDPFCFLPLSASDALSIILWVTQCRGKCRREQEVRAFILLLCFRSGLNFKMKGVENTDLNETSWVSLGFYYLWFDINALDFQWGKKDFNILALPWLPSFLRSLSSS